MPLWQPGFPFFPEAIPGFEIGFRFSGGETLTVPGLLGTLDTGAPEMVLRLNEDDPQNGGRARQVLHLRWVLEAVEQRGLRP